MWKKQSCPLYSFLHHLSPRFCGKEAYLRIDLISEGSRTFSDILLEQSYTSIGSTWRERSNQGKEFMFIATSSVGGSMGGDNNSKSREWFRKQNGQR